jgi:hypothetical protein
MRPASSRKLGWLTLLAAAKAQYNSSNSTAYDYVDPLIGTINGGKSVLIDVRITAKSHQVMFSPAQLSPLVRSSRCQSGCVV